MLSKAVLSIETQKRFEQDVKLCKKRGKDLHKLKSVVADLCAKKSLKPKHKPHRLSGKYQRSWECHIEPDWLLIWDIEGDTLRLLRTGSHADLF